MTEGDLTFVKSILEVCSVEVDDSGIYSCFADNEFGNDTANFEFVVDTEGMHVAFVSCNKLELMFLFPHS